MATPRKITPLIAGRLLARVGELLQQIANRQARQDAKIARAQARLDAAKAQKAAADERDAVVIDRAARKLWEFFQANAGEAKHLDVATGRLATVTRRQGATVKLDTDEAIAAEIMDKFPHLYDDLVEVVHKPRLRAIKALDEVVQALTTIDVPGAAVFTIEPDNTELKYSRPLAYYSPAER